MQTRYLFILRFILPVVDITMLNCSYLLALYFIDDHANIFHLERGTNYLVICNLLWLTSAIVFGLYSEAGANRIERIYRATWKILITHGVLFTIYIFFANHRSDSRAFVVIFYGILILLSIVNRVCGTIFQYVLVKRFRATKAVAIVGNNYTAARLKRYLKQQRNVQFYGYIGAHDGIYTDSQGKLSQNTTLELKAAVSNGVKDLYVCISPEEMRNIKSFISEADKLLIRLKFIPDIQNSPLGRYNMSYMGGEFPLITIRNEPLENIGDRFKKRSFDLIFSTFVIIFLLSWLYPIIGIVIKFQSKGPVLFKQKRSGRDDQPFDCLKFRSMKVNATSHNKQATRNDDRTTPIGRFLRRTSLDELPQFFNVWRGDMSVVGPRPHMLKHTAEYRALIDKFMVRHFAKPGITGWAQVNGFRGETKETIDMSNRVDHDIYYVENWSLMWDIKIIILTVINIIRGEDNAF